MHKNFDLRRQTRFREAQGYLELEMPTHALRVLDAIEDPDAAPFEMGYLRGMALRELKQFREALAAFRPALEVRPDDVSLLLAMAWCYKRIDRVTKSIEMLERAYKAKPDEALILYNLSCYWALLGNKTQALSWLGRALRMDPSYRDLIPTETDFDPLRNDPDFHFVADPSMPDRKP